MHVSLLLQAHHESVGLVIIQFDRHIHLSVHTNDLRASDTQWLGRNCRCLAATGAQAGSRLGSTTDEFRTNSK